MAEALEKKPRFFQGHVEYDDLQTTTIGVVVPFDFALDWEYWRYLPDGVILYFTRTAHINELVGTKLARAVSKKSEVAAATRALSAVDPAVVAYACASGSFVRGLAGEEALRRAMIGAGARRAITSTSAMLSAFKALGVRRVALASPYTKSLTGQLVEFVEEAGYEVVNAVYLGLSGNIWKVSRDTVAELVRQTARGVDCDAVYLSCTSVRTLGIVAELEREMGHPMLTTNQVTLWSALKVAGIFRDEHLADSEWVLGDADPMAESTRLLLESSGVSRSITAVEKSS